MTAHTRRVVAAMLVFAGMFSPDFARAQDTDRDRSQATDPDSRTESATLSNAEIEALYRARQDSARMRFTQADVDFVTGMISHHAQALIMSELAPTHGASPAVETLAARIINAQRDEIALMQRWLADRGQPVPQVKIDGLNLAIEMSAPAGGDAAHDAHMAAGAHEHRMPGMLTREQLEEMAAQIRAAAMD